MRTLRRHPATRLLTRCLIVAVVLGVTPELASASYATTPSVGLIHADYIGSVRRLTNEDGNITDGYTYSAFGELLAHTGSDPQPYAFTGEPLDPNSGWQYHRARWMDPRVGRFAGMDPWEGSPRGPRTLHRYGYAVGDPVDATDPSGLFSDLAISGLVIGTLSAMSCLGCGRAIMEIALSNALGAPESDAGKQATLVVQSLMDVEAILDTDNECSRSFAAAGTPDGWQRGRRLLPLLREAIKLGRLASTKSGIELSDAKMVQDMSLHDTYDVYARAVINTSGPFFRSFDAETAGTPRMPDVGSFKANTRQARSLMLLHELSHFARTIPSDGAVGGPSARNTETVEKRCHKEILGQVGG